MKSVIEEMEEVIRKNLPEATVSTLKKYLEEAEENKGRLREKDILLEQGALRLKGRDAEISELRVRLLQLEALERTNLELGVREQAVIKNETAAAVAFANLKVSEAEKRADAVYKLAEIVFRNPTLVRSVCKSSNSSKSLYSGQDSLVGNETETTREGIE